MPEYNFNFSELDNLNYDAGVDLKFMNTDGGKRLMYGTPPPADVMRYPLKAIEKEQDMLLIRIFDQVQSDEVFSLFGEERTVTNAKGEQVKERPIKLGPLETKNQTFNNAGSTYDGEKALKKNARYIWLPIPQQISDSISVGYSEDTLNPIQAIGMAIASDAITNPAETAEKAIGALQNIDAFSDRISPSTIQALKTSLAGNAINQLGANVNAQSLITRSSGQILQSNLELLFNNVTLRSFPFTFDFTPREPKEADMVKKIIRTIKKATVPKRGNGIFINSPDLFQFQYVAGGERQHPFLNRFKVGVVETVSVDYTASGTYATYSDRTPVHIRMTLAFKEINPIYMEDYDDAASEGAEGPGIHGVGY